MKRKPLLWGSGICIAILTIFAAPAPVHAEIGSLDLGSSMTAECITTDCSQVLFLLDLERDAYVDFVRIFSSDADQWTFGSVVNVTDRTGAVLPWLGGVTANELTLKTGGLIYGAEPIYITVNMSTQSSESNLWNGSLTYKASGDTESLGGGTQVSVGGTVTPEPISMVLLGTGMLGIAGARRRKRSEFEGDGET